MKNLIPVFIFLCSFFLSATAQTDSTATAKLFSFVKNVSTFNRLYPQEKVYLHFDNTSYYLGEAIWFKAYVVDASNLRFTGLSKVLYVELLNDAGITLETKKLKIEKGQCHGEFQLKTDYQAGFYQIRAYTRYMLNFGNEKREIDYVIYGDNENISGKTPYYGNLSIFSRTFPIYDRPDSLCNYNSKRMKKHPRHTALSFPKTANIKIEQSKEETFPVALNFFPEGGCIVAGIKSDVAFEIRERGTGKPIEISGSLIDAVGKELQPFRTLYNGRGIFSILPEKGKVYYARIYYKGEFYKYKLPEISPSGYAMHVNNTTYPDKAEVSITKAEDMSAEPLGYTIMCRGKVSLFDTLAIRQSGTIKLEIPMEKLAAGVNQITLFDTAGIVLSERLFFVYPKENQFRFKVRENKSIFDSYEKINLDFDLSDADESPVSTTFSLSVTDEDARDESYYTGNICTDLLLSSDLKGFIENASTYFSDSTAADKQHLDLLMLVQGWRRYNWREMTGIQKFDLKHRIESKLTIDGFLVDFTKPREIDYDRSLFPRILNVDVKMELGQDSLRFISTYPANKKGQFSFVLNDDIYGKYPLALTIIDRKKNTLMEKALPVLNRAFSPDIEPYTYYETHYPFENNSFYTPVTQTDSIIDNKMKNYVLGEVTVKGKKSYRGVVQYEFPDITIDTEELIDLGIDLMAMDINDYHSLAIPIMYKYRLYGSMDFFIEDAGKRYSNLELARWPEPSRIQTVKIYTNKLMREEYAIPPLKGGKKSVPDVVFGHVLYPDKYERPHTFNNGIRYTTFRGYDRPAEFYTPDYSNRLLPLKKDFRRTLYWNPDVKTDENGKASVQFYNNSTCKHIRISAEGLTKNGIPMMMEE